MNVSLQRGGGWGEKKKYKKEKLALILLLSWR